ncbi:MAG TPA: glycosyltransferase [Gaiellaceae bacterium]|jgi:cellulose synthase (UDP-forming)
MAPVTEPHVDLADQRSLLLGQTVGLPRFPGGERPAPESRGRRRLIHGISALAVLATFAYLAWRIAYTIDLSFWWIALPLLALELHNALGLAMFTVALWDVDAGPRVGPRDTTDLRIAVLVPTYDEPQDVILPTIAAAVALEPAHETWVLDDGHRAEVEQLAQELGARYLARSSNEHAKAGNLNNALETVDADIVAVLDADHIARPDFLRHTIGYFDDPDVALVQTPQDFYNLDSFEHQVRGRAKLFNEQWVFYRVIAAGKNRWGGAFWCGTGALVRVAALRSVGGVATGTVTEDIHTTIRLHRRGWKTVYHNEVLARGLAARTAGEYLLQRRRWATGAMQVLRRERPLTGPGLSFGQRLGYATTLWGWFDAWRSLGYILLPVAVIATGAVPINAPLAVFGPLFLSVLAIQFVALRLLARGHYPPILSILFEFLRMPAVLAGTLALVRDRPRAFKVTPKGVSADPHSKGPVPMVTVALLALSGIALVWFVLTTAGLTAQSYGVPGAVYGACVFLLANATLLAASASRVRRLRFARERRAGVRLPVLLVGAVDGARCRLLDLSLTGARVVTADCEVPEQIALSIDLAGTRVTLDTIVRRRLEAAGGRVELGLEFAAGQSVARARLAVALLATNMGRKAPRAAPAARPAPAASPPRRPAVRKRQLAQQPSVR